MSLVFGLDVFGPLWRSKEVRPLQSLGSFKLGPERPITFCKSLSVSPERFLTALKPLKILKLFTLLRLGVPVEDDSVWNTRGVVNTNPANEGTHVYV